MHLLYSAALAALLAIGMPYWIFQTVRHGKYRAGLAERLGRVPARLRGSAGPSIWVHAVSVGEVLAVSTLVEQLRLRYPAHRVVVSTTTLTGQTLARERFGENNVFYFPFDFSFAQRPYFELLRPQLLIVAETEFWPNFFRLGERHGAHIAVVNARISDRSFSGYRAFRWWMRRVLGRVSVFLAQSEIDRQRLALIGADPRRARVTGNLKFDIQAPTATPLAQGLREAIPASAPMIVCGSTAEGEEDVLLAAFKAVLAHYPDAVLLLAPRRPERFDAVAQLLASAGLKFQRRSRLRTAGRFSGGVFLLDSMGELGSLYGLATLAFVGGSLVPRGGHNILEPARHGVAITVGPYTENFRDIVNLFLRADAIRVVDSRTLGGEWLRLLEDGSQRAALAQRAAAVFRANAGATARTLAELEPLLAGSPPHPAKRVNGGLAPTPARPKPGPAGDPGAGDPGSPAPPGREAAP